MEWFEHLYVPGGAAATLAAFWLAVRLAGQGDGRRFVAHALALHLAMACAFAALASTWLGYGIVASATAFPFLLASVLVAAALERLRRARRVPGWPAFLPWAALVAMLMAWTMPDSPQPRHFAVLLGAAAAAAALPFAAATQDLVGSALAAAAGLLVAGMACLASILGIEAVVALLAAYLVAVVVLDVARRWSDGRPWGAASGLHGAPKGRA